MLWYIICPNHAWIYIYIYYSLIIYYIFCTESIWILYDVKLVAFVARSQQRNSSHCPGFLWPWKSWDIVLPACMNVEKRLVRNNVKQSCYWPVLTKDIPKLCLHRSSLQFICIKRKKTISNFLGSNHLSCFKIHVGVVTVLDSDTIFLHACMHQDQYIIFSSSFIGSSCFSSRKSSCATSRALAEASCIAHVCMYEGCGCSLRYADFLPASFTSSFSSSSFTSSFGDSWGSWPPCCTCTLEKC